MAWFLWIVFLFFVFALCGSIRKSHLDRPFSGGKLDIVSYPVCTKCRCQNLDSKKCTNTPEKYAPNRIASNAESCVTYLLEINCIPNKICFFIKRNPRHKRQFSAAIAPFARFNFWAISSPAFFFFPSAMFALNEYNWFQIHCNRE